MQAWLPGSCEKQRCVPVCVSVCAQFCASFSFLIREIWDAPSGPVHESISQLMGREKNWGTSSNSESLKHVQAFADYSSDSQSNIKFAHILRNSKMDNEIILKISIEVPLCLRQALKH